MFEDATNLQRDLADVNLLQLPFKTIRRIVTLAKQNFSEISAGKLQIRIALIGGFNIDYLPDYLRVFLLQRGISAEILVAGYGQLVQEVIFGGPTLLADPDLVIMLPSHRDLRHAPPLGANLAQAKAAAEDEAAFWRDLLSKVAKPTVFLSFDQPEWRQLGEQTGFSPSGLGAHARRVNQLLHDQLPSTTSLVDAEALHARLGAAWRDPHVYALCKQPFAMDALPVVADTLGAAVAARLGKARKVMVLDLDNTVWGGVVGDIGMDNLELGVETPEGEAFVRFQRYAKSLAERGILLALCSKNNRDIAWEAFTRHPAMVLQEADISAYTINFEDKATNIRSLAATLNVGLDSIVFIDDNPIERAWVRDQLPEVAVVELPENPALYVDAIEAANLFPLTALTSEDLSRTRSYQAISVARQGQSSASDVDAFLADLRQVATVERIGSGSIDRVVQLMAKTNQFKLNPGLFDSEYVAGNAEHVFALRMVDRLQDYGIVAVAVTRPNGDHLEILNWVMSCRVFSRRLEHVMVEIVWNRARELGLSQLSLQFVPSAKNGTVPDSLVRIGFTTGDPAGTYGLTEHAPTENHHTQIRYLERANCD